MAHACFIPRRLAHFCAAAALLAAASAAQAQFACAFNVTSSPLAAEAPQSVPALSVLALGLLAAGLASVAWRCWAWPACWPAKACC
jgi:hypothetical protein